MLGYHDERQITNRTCRAFYHPEIGEPWQANTTMRARRATPKFAKIFSVLTGNTGRQNKGRRIKTGRQNQHIQFMVRAVFGDHSITVYALNAFRDEVTIILLQGREIILSKNQPFAHGCEIGRQFGPQVQIGNFFIEMIAADLIELLQPKWALAARGRRKRSAKFQIVDPIS